MNLLLTKSFRIGCALGACFASTPATAAQLGHPVLVDELVLTQDALPDVTPALSFSPAHEHGALIFGKRVYAGCNSNTHDMYAAQWTAAGWTTPEFVPGQQDPGRHWRFAIAFEPVADAFIVTLGASQVSSTCRDEVDSRRWSGAWDGGPFRLGDGDDDDDLNGSIRFASDGSYAVAVWADELGGATAWRIVGRVWDASQQLWRPTQEIQSEDGAQPINVMRHNHAVEQDPASNGWIVAYQKRSTGFGGPDPTSADVAYRVGTADPTAFAFGSELKVTDDLADPIYDGQPTLAFHGSGAGGAFFHRAVDGSDLELMAAVWDSGSSSFGAPLQLTADDQEQRLAAVVPAAGGWHVFSLALPTGATSPAIHHAWFDGAVLSNAVRLTFGGHVGGFPGESHMVETGVDAALSADGRIFLSWEEWDGISIDTTEIHVAELVFIPGAPQCFGDGSAAPCGCDNEAAPGSETGCLNGLGVGAELSASGSNSIAADDLVLTSSGITNQPGLFFQGDNAIGGGTGITFGDGIRCCGQNVIRLEIVDPPGPTQPTTASTTISIANHAPPGTVSPGDTKCYQHWYRNPGTSPCGSNFNLSNAIAVTWGL